MMKSKQVCETANNKRSQWNQLLTVEKLIAFLQKEDMDAVIAIEGNSPANTVTLMTRTWQCGTFLMHPYPRLQKECFCPEEIHDEDKPKMIKTLVMTSRLLPEEPKDFKVPYLDLIPLEY